MLTPSGATIGGTTTGAGNIISGNTDDGVDIDASPAWSRATSSARMRPAPPPWRTATTALMSTPRARRSAGPRPAPATSSPETRTTALTSMRLVPGRGQRHRHECGRHRRRGERLDGIFVDRRSGATIGGTTAGAGNIISGNTDDGVDIVRRAWSRATRSARIRPAPPPWRTTIDGIYVDASGCHDRRDHGRRRQHHLRKHGRRLYIVASCLVEGNVSARMRPAPPPWRMATTAFMLTPRARRSAGPRPAPATSSPETRRGVDIDASSCLVEGNEIGTNAAGTAAVANGHDGIDVDASGCARSAGPRPAPATSSPETRNDGVVHRCFAAWSRATNRHE